MKPGRMPAKPAGGTPTLPPMPDRRRPKATHLRPEATVGRPKATGFEDDDENEDEDDPPPPGGWHNLAMAGSIRLQVAPYPGMNSGAIYLPPLAGAFDWARRASH